MQEEASLESYNCQSGLHFPVQWPQIILQDSVNGKSEPITVAVGRPAGLLINFTVTGVECDYVLIILLPGHSMEGAYIWTGLEPVMRMIILP